MAQPTIQNSEENFEDLLNEFFTKQDILEGSVLRGKILSFTGDDVLIDVGLKSEGRIPLKEFWINGKAPDLHVGDTVDVFLEKVEDKNGEAVLSREKAKREAAWKELEEHLKNDQHVQGTIFGRVKGGFTVDLSGAVAFLPGSQVDVRPIRDVSPLIGICQPFKILKMDRARSNIVVSRRAIMEETRDEARAELISTLEEGQVLQGIVKNILDYGAFIDLGGVDGLLHVTDISWKRIQNPEELLCVGDSLSVKIIRFNSESKRISLGLKQLTQDPWENVSDKFVVGQRLKGRITNVTDYGAFVELQEGVEGLIHISEMSWSKKNISPGSLVGTSQEVEVMILDVDSIKRRISLGLKQCIENPWEKLVDAYPEGSEFEGIVKNITEFGLFIGVSDDIDGMVHLSDLSWEKGGDEALSSYRKGDKVRVKILDIEPHKERISLGIKQLTANPYEAIFAELKKGAIVTCDVTAILDTGLEVTLMDGAIPGFIRKSELSRDRAEQRTNRFTVGQKVDAKITVIDSNAHKVTLTIKGKEVDEDRQAIANFGSSDTGGSLGDILEAAISRAEKQDKRE